MTNELFNALEALCMMWEQYCSGEWGHECMTAGESAEEVLDKYNLLIHKTGYKSDINEKVLESYREQVYGKRGQAE